MTAAALRNQWIASLIFAWIVFSWVGSLRAEGGGEFSGAVPRDVSDLIGLAQRHQQTGHFGESFDTIQRALARLGEDEDVVRARLLILRANARLAIGPPESARHDLEVAIEIARSAGAPRLEAFALLTTGNLEASLGRNAAAIEILEKSARQSAELGLPILAARARANAARIAVTAALDVERVDSNLRAAHTLIDSLPLGPDRAELEISLAYTDSLVLAQGTPDPGGVRLERAHGSLVSARAQAEAAGSKRSMADCDGILASLYERAGRLDEGLLLTRRALGAIDPNSDLDARGRWLRQEARILLGLGREAEATAVLREAIDILEAIRPRLSRTYADGSRAFSEHIEPVFYELADLLLKTRSHSETEASRQSRLGEARRVLERLKAAELRDYFRDDCVDNVRANPAPLDQIKQAAVLYPISLVDRLELIVTTTEGLRQVTVPVEADQLAETARAFRILAMDPPSRRFQRPAAQLYDWLIRPIESQIGERTLVVIPHGILRTIPFAALFDGELLLADRFPSAISPGLELTDATPIDRNATRILLTGISKPIEGYQNLPSVASEIEGIARSHSSAILLDDQFNSQTLEAALKDPKINVLHIASHGIVAPAVSDSYMLMWNEKLSFADLSRFIGSLSFREQPLDLITLSACETAAGDERAALGLAGLAVESGARSALGSLWRVDDRASAILMIEFYAQLRKPGVSKASALQRAQRKVAQTAGFEHPVYWAGFVLISNWL